MADFADLPNELLIEILSYMLQPKDIENFASVSKTIRTLSGKVLLEHRKLTRQFSSFEIGAPKSRVSAAGLLKVILKNPHFALYVKHFSIISYHGEWESEQKGLNTLMALDQEVEEDGCYYRHTPYAEKDIELFKQAVKRAQQFFDIGPKTKEKLAPYPCDDLETDVWCLGEMIEYGYEYPIIVLLLLLLTNLKTVAIEAIEVDELFFTILAYSSQAQGIDILKRPIEVKILNMGDKRACEFARRSISHILPSVRTIHNDIPGKMVPENCLSFDLRVWSSNVDGTLAIK